MSQLRECPLCESAKVYLQDCGCMAACDYCGLQLHRSDPEDTVRDWNTRPPAKYDKETAIMAMVKDYAESQKQYEAQFGGRSSWSQCSREYEGRRYRVIVADYDECPVKKLRDLSSSTPAKYDDAKVDAHKLAVDVLTEVKYACQYWPDYDMPINLPDKVRRALDAIAALTAPKDGGE